MSHDELHLGSKRSCDELHLGGMRSHDELHFGGIRSHDELHVVRGLEVWFATMNVSLSAGCNERSATPSSRSTGWSATCVSWCSKFIFTLPNSTTLSSLSSFFILAIVLVDLMVVWTRRLNRSSVAFLFEHFFKDPSPCLAALYCVSVC